MRVKSRVVYLVFTMLAGIGLPSVAWADNTTCLNANYLFPGEVIEDTVSGDIYFKTVVRAGRSYSFHAWAPFTDVGEAPLNTPGPDLAVFLYTESTCTTTAATTGGDSEPGVKLVGHQGDHTSLIPTLSGGLWVRVHNFKPTSYKVHVRVLETTLFSPWWFVGGTNQAFVEIRNNTWRSVDYTATFFDASGTVCGSTSATLPPDGNTAHSVGTIGSCATAGSGSAQIAFQGASGALVANITTIDGVQATSFDSPFVPRMVWGGSH